MKKTNESKTPDSVLKALIDAGYKPVRGFGRKGSTATFHLKPAMLAGKDGNFRALEVCAALDLQADCRKHNAQPEAILIVEVDLGEEAEETTPEADDTQASSSKNPADRSDA